LEHIKNNNILVKEEFGFISKLSKEAASYSLISDILNALNNKNIIGGIICDLNKAFDCIHQSTLPSKLWYNRYILLPNSILFRRETSEG